MNRHRSQTVENAILSKFFRTIVKVNCIAKVYGHQMVLFVCHVNWRYDTKNLPLCFGVQTLHGHHMSTRFYGQSIMKNNRFVFSV